jgi:alpha-L-rhamnosidase
VSNITVSSIQIEHLRDNLGIGFNRPRLSWQLETDLTNWQQTAYQIACFDSDGQEREQSVRVESDQSVLVEWPFVPLQSRERISLRVRVWGTADSVSEWSEPIMVEVGLLNPTDWQADFITPTWEEDASKSNPAPYLRREFEPREGIQSARLYITALGVYETQLNGQVIGDQVLAPGWTPYNQRLRYQTFDVTDLLKPGRNALGAVLGDGWYRGRLGFGGGRRNIYGENLALLAQLEIRYADGTSEIIVSDENWRAGMGAILMSSLYDGETYDARLAPIGWGEPGFDDADWTAVHKLEHDLETLAASLGPPVRRIETLDPVSITQSPAGKTLVDFGQNLVGRLSIRVQGEAGQTITLRHAEVLENGELGTRPLRTAEATDHYTLRGGGS